MGRISMSRLSEAQRDVVGTSGGYILALRNELGKNFSLEWLGALLEAVLPGIYTGMKIWTNSADQVAEILGSQVDFTQIGMPSRLLAFARFQRHRSYLSLIPLAVIRE